MSIFSELNSEIVNAGTVRYDSVNDRFQVLLNGTWVNSIKAYADNLILFDGTSFYAEYENGVYSRNQYDTVTSGFTINLPNFIAPLKTVNNTCSSFVFKDAIDMTYYSSLIIETSIGTFTVDVTNVTTNAYIVFDTVQSGGGTRAYEFIVTSQKQYYTVGILAIVSDTMTANFYIYNVRLVK